MADIKMILAQDRARVEFAERAAKWFDEHPEHWSYSDGDPKPGQMFALRWAAKPGKPTISVMVFELPYDAVIVGDLDTVKELPIEKLILDGQPSRRKTFDEVLAETRIKAVYEHAARWCNRPLSVLKAGATVLENDARMWEVLHQKVAAVREYMPEQRAQDRKLGEAIAATYTDRPPHGHAVYDGPTQWSEFTQNGERFVRCKRCLEFTTFLRNKAIIEDHERLCGGARCPATLGNHQCDLKFGHAGRHRVPSVEDRLRFEHDSDCIAQWDANIGCDCPRPVWQHPRGCQCEPCKNLRVRW